MGAGSPLSRRALLTAAAAGAAGCRREPPAWSGRWVGAAHERGHRLHQPPPAAVPAKPRRAAVVIVGAGIAGLAAARAFARAGVDDLALLELEDGAGGNSRAHRMHGIACPLGAHYLPVPGPQAHEVSELLHELGLLRHEAGRTVAAERHLSHSPQERLFIDGGFVEGLLPPAASGSATLDQYRRFARAVARVQPLGFALPTGRARWGAEHAALDAISFDAWLQREGLDDAKLRWYLDYCCRDDYGAGSAEVSAWAGLHYFASRHGFAAPGDEGAEREPVFTWPEGNGWLVARLAVPLAERVHAARTVQRVAESRHGVEVLAFDHRQQQWERWSADRVVLAVPVMVAARLVEGAGDALREAASLVRYASWLVANLHLERPLLDRAGAAPAWDSVAFGSRALGYVDAMHQSLRATPGATVLTAYTTLPPELRPALLERDWRYWAERAVDDLAEMHPDLRSRPLEIDLMRYGHAMPVPRPGVRSSAALAALRAARGRIRYAHCDLVGYSVFEEAFTLGTAVAERW
jgi:predicted NAD/FAD-dependent oxidoreductase